MVRELERPISEYEMGAEVLGAMLPEWDRIDDVDSSKKRRKVFTSPEANGRSIAIYLTDTQLDIRDSSPLKTRLEAYLSMVSPKISSDKSQLIFENEELLVRFYPDGRFANIRTKMPKDGHLNQMRITF